MKRRYVVIVAPVLIALFYSLTGCAATGPPSEEQRNAFRAAKTVWVSISLYEPEGADPIFPFENVSQRLLSYAGLTIVGDASACDLTMEIRATLKAVSASYSSEGHGTSHHYYSGAYVSGAISLRSASGIVYRKAFDGYEYPPAFLYGGGSSSPSGAPFYKALTMKGSFLPTMMLLLGEIYGPNFLIAALGDNDGWVRMNAVEALVKIGDASAVEPLIAALRNKEVVVRENAAEALGKIGDARAVEPLIAALGDNDGWVRVNAAEALGKIGDARAVEPLIVALGNKDVVVREKAAEALGKIGDARAVEPLIAALEDKTWFVRRNAAEALGKIGGARAVEPLIAALGDEDSLVKREARGALSEITGKRFGMDQAKWSKWWDKNKDTFKIKKEKSSE